MISVFSRFVNTFGASCGATVHRRCYESTECVEPLQLSSVRFVGGRRVRGEMSRAAAEHSRRLITINYIFYGALAIDCTYPEPQTLNEHKASAAFVTKLLRYFFIILGR